LNGPIPNAAEDGDQSYLRQGLKEIGLR